MKTILVPIDFSEATNSVIDAAGALATAMDARVVLLHVVQPLVIASDHGITADSFQETVPSSEKYAARRLAELGENLRARGLRHVETVQAGGPAHTAILEQAQKRMAGHIVMVSHGHTAFYDLLVGSTTQHVMRKAACPVMIVPRPRP